VACTAAVVIVGQDVPLLRPRPSCLMSPLVLVWKTQQRRLPCRRMPGVGARPASFQTETTLGLSEVSGQWEKGVLYATDAGLC